MKHSKQNGKRSGLLRKLALAVVLLLALVLLGGKLWFWYPAAGYYRASQAVFTIPGLLDGYVPQGLAYDDQTDTLLLTGYTTNHSASPLYVVDRTTGKTLKCVTFTLSDGSLCTYHNGGISIANGLIYLCDSHTNALRVFSLDALHQASDGGTLQELGAIPLAASSDAISPAFVTECAEGLIVGEFYRPKDYETPLSHHIGTQHALAVLLPYDASALGVSSVPVRAYSLPDQVQGMCFDADGLLYASESWGTSPSTIEVFSPTGSDGEADVLGVRVPLTVLDSRRLVSAQQLAPMAEEIVIVNGKLYTNCESASMKYFFGWLNGANKLFATDVSFFK